MRRADRMIELVGHLRARTVVRAEELAGQLEVSVRTIYRDVATLQALGHPIEGQAGVGFMLRGEIHLPPISFDHDELEALALGLAYVEQVGDPKLAAAARAARGKADMVWSRAAGGPPGARALRSSQRPGRRAPQLGSALRGALRARRLVRFQYRDEERRATAREVRPLALTAYSDGWLLGAWCLLREDFRTFRLDRMSALSIADAFQDEPGRDLAAYLARPSRARIQAGGTQTNVDIDDALLSQAMSAEALTDRRASVEEGLRLLVRVHEQAQAVADLAGLGWDGDLDEIRHGHACAPPVAEA